MLIAGFFPRLTGTANPFRFLCTLKHHFKSHHVLMSGLSDAIDSGLIAFANDIKPGGRYYAME
jgi:hypothetical protein